MSQRLNRQDVTAQNRIAWEEAAPIHARHNQARLIKAFKASGHSSFDDVATEMLQSLNITGKDVAQVCCNNGIELISAKNMGAARCVGFDAASGFLDQGREIAAAAQQDVAFVCCDAYDLPATYHAEFDLVIITIGVLSWMPDIDTFMAGVALLLRRGGAVFIYEHHSVLLMMEPGPADAPVDFELSYFTKAPYVDEDGLDYFKGEHYEATPNISFNHKMSDILMSCVKAGLQLEHFEERPKHISNLWWNVEAADIGMPMSFTLVMRQAV
ncbi:MAG: class I SAM-dependent methyltransferase [Cognatishimia sp.]|uniref:class I SAM-dependent methyltransferase n=1 Tax=Cognatishimia sp. TaxID=2211648 RepID=UPI003B8BCAE9